MNIAEFIQTMNEWGHKQVPFLFMVDFELQKPIIISLDSVDKNSIRFDVNGFTNDNTPPAQKDFSFTTFEKNPISFDAYNEKFATVANRLFYGDSFLTNLTVKTEIKLTHSLLDLFLHCKAKYKLLVNDQFLVFSPETFIQIRDGKIFSYPMKGTIDASLPNAKESILANKKELAEHVTIVDLIRNDLSQVSSQVEVTRFRYVDEIKTDNKNLLQVSSEITGILPPDYVSRLGNILVSLLPAGSVSGAPKAKTLEIIKEAEKEVRGYYTGVFGYFNGLKLDSGVMIRYIENRNGIFFYRSGGGITTQSIAEEEYREMIDKVYVPLT